MNEIPAVQRCPACNANLPARGYFCGSCATQARCRSCGELLEPGAKACVMCGTALGSGSGTDAARVVGGNVPMNTLELQEDTKSRSLRISFTDAAVSNIGEAVNQIVFDRMMQRGSKATRHISDDGYRQQALLPPSPEPHPEEGGTPRRIGSSSSNGAGGDSRINQVFEPQDDDFRLEEHRLKADSRLEYARRLTYLYIYAHEVSGRKPIEIGLVRRMLDACKVLDNNTRHELAHKMAVEIDGEQVRLKREGRERAIEALNQILDPAVLDPGWTPESQTRAVKSGESKETKSAGKRGRKKSTVPDDWAVKWDKLSDKPNAHFALKDKGLLDKSICGLWAIHRVGGKAASFVFLQRFMAEAFSFKERDRSIEKALTRETARDFVIKGDGGFKLTPSGTKRAEELMKGK